MKDVIETGQQADLIDRLFLGAGAMKAGTTWLYQVLDRHPALHFTPEKEIHYFYAAAVRPGVLSDRIRLTNVRDKYLRIDPDRSAPAAVRARLRWAAAYLDGPVDDYWYRQLFAARPDGAWACDFSNYYALLPVEAWRRLADRTGTLRVLYTMRDPLKRLWSHVKFHLAVTGRTQDLDDWGPDRLRAFARQDFLWENAEYGAAVRRMRAGLPPDALRIAWHEEIHADERGFLAGIEDFLGIAPHAYPDRLLARKVNTTEDRPMPDWLPDLFADDVRRIVAELRDEGLSPPPGWQVP